MSNNQNFLYALEWFNTSESNSFKLKVTPFFKSNKALEYIGRTKANAHCISTENPLDGSEDDQ